MNVLNVLISDIHKEMTVMCSRKTNSILRKSTPEAMAGFTWESIMEELEAYAPTLLSILSGCVKVKRRVRKGFAKRTENKRQRRWKRKSNRCAETAVLGVCAAIIFRNRNMHMNLVQRIISVLLNSGHASKQVSILFVYSVHSHIPILKHRHIPGCRRYYCVCRTGAPLISWILWVKGMILRSSSGGMKYRRQ